MTAGRIQALSEVIDTVFSSMIFVFVFFAAVIPAHSLCQSTKGKNLCLLAASLFFYCWAGLGFAAVLLFDTAVCWFFALLVEGCRGGLRRGLCGVCVAILLAVLTYFKYSSFLLGSLRRLTGFSLPVPGIALPLGISFYTFQLVSYVVDVYRGQAAAQRRFWMLLLYASLFPQCVAGPIVRYGDVARELHARRVAAAQLSRGISRFTVGLAKKAVLANGCAVVADTFFAGDAAALALRPAAGLFLSGLAYMMQVYLDFSAYSDMALGMGLMLGFRYGENFDYPYLAVSVTGFWRRWHISLSRFFRDYVYIPLGGNRCGRARRLYNLFVVWTLTGLWHGASWNYLLWGLYFFGFLAAEKLLPARRSRRAGGVPRHARLLLIVYFSWILFRFEDLSSLRAVLAGLFCLNGNPLFSLQAWLVLRANWVLLLVCTIACTPLCAALRLLLRDLARRGGTVRWLYAAVEALHPVLLLVVSAMALTGGSYNPFLYWQF